MYCRFRKIVLLSNSARILQINRSFHKNPHIDVKDEVRLALETRKPVVALESTIITHGMPFPNNIKCASEVENIVRAKGAIPATIAIINGRIKVGLSEAELSFLGNTEESKPIKTSRRDLAYVVSNKLNGGTTVCGTLIIAKKVTISVFATGGIGGVHRGADKTFDISGDLIELGKSGVAVVSSGVKSILDIPKTLEYLETQGVFVATFGSNKDFPAFYTRISGSKAAYCVENVTKAAQIIKCNRDMDLRSGMLFAVPIPEEHALHADIINNAIEEALQKNKKHIEVMGKDVTPYLLSQVAKITDGKSLQSNIALIKNNAGVAAEIAVALAKLEVEQSEEFGGPNGDRLPKNAELEGRPVVIGGSNLDVSAHLSCPDIKLDGRIHSGSFSYSAGGVGRNICESLCKLGRPPNFVSAVGDDEPGKLLKTFIPRESAHLVRVLKGQPTAQCIIVFDKKGDCKFLMGDMQIHQQITPDMIQRNEDIIKTAPLVVLDANLSVECLESALKLAAENSIPVLFEPTDVEISSKPFTTLHWKAIKLITPNLNELRQITTFLGFSQHKIACSNVEEAAHLAKQLAECIDNVIVTLGPSGVVVARSGMACDPFLKNKQTNEINVRHYSCPTIINDFVNVSGAGDCLASAIITGTLQGLSEEQCLSAGFAAARLALYSQSAVPKKMFDESHESYKSAAAFQIINL